MASLLLYGKEFGEYKGYKYFRLHFLSPIDEKNGEGHKPLTLKCTQNVYDRFLVGEEYRRDELYYDRYGKVIGCEA